MKAKKINKKLTLNKVTVTHLGSSSMARVKGGDPLTLDTDCATCNGTTCIVTLCNDYTCANTCGVSCPTYWKLETCWGVGCVD